MNGMSFPKQERKKRQQHKPGSVYLFIYLTASLPVQSQAVYPQYTGEQPELLLNFAPDEVYRALSVASQAVSSYLAFSPLPLCSGGIFSAALSVTEQVSPRTLSGIMFYGARTFLPYSIYCIGEQLTLSQ